MSDIDWEDLFGVSDDNDHDNDDANGIPGLKLAKNALTHEQQMQLVYAIAEADYFQGGKLDQAMCFGDLGPFEWVEPWIRDEYPNLMPSRILERACLFDQAIINLYHKGQGIKSHVDLMRFDDGIVIISLLSSCVMVMKPVDPATLQQRGAIPILLRPGDVLALSGAARYDWEHGIEERMADEVDGEWIERGTRISVTLRKLLVK
ncbi:hypothetical protein O0I10_002351 [Lichtheimia ornata]|uniref:Fe2OG dioxygenase domain-containing protein n=1 Tax=Lichtheimia ornata TaxID=688661 RepID=A0AAD7VAR2_9FUNG|nr:uncharacterized protein O0I10_002351 [Lichtheimia ornata]KAJ8662020.1 hypothetical protein O0I10_002351 [Lichtheimia ornata]